jgi:hypothetical protein
MYADTTLWPNCQQMHCWFILSETYAKYTIGKDREFYIAEVREAFIETIPFSLPIHQRHQISDAFEAQVGNHFANFSEKL